MVGNDSNDVTEKQYFNLLSGGGLTVSSSQMAEFVYAYFAIFDYADKFIERHNESSITESTERILETCSRKYMNNTLKT